MSITDKITLTGSKYEEHRQYWQKHLSEGEAFSFRQDTKSGAGLNNEAYRELTYNLDGDIVALLYKLSAGNTMAMWVMLLGGVGIVFRKYARTDKVMVESPLLGRVKDVIEPYVRLSLSSASDDTVREYLNSIKSEIKEAYKYQNYPYDLVSQEMSGSDIYVAYDGIHQYFHTYTPHLFSIFFSEKKGVSFKIRYAEKHYTERFIKQFTGHLSKALQSLAGLSEEIRKIDLLTEGEKQWLNENQPASSVKGAPSTLIEGFEAMVSQNPNHLCLVTEETQLTYAQVNEQANAYAFYLQKQFGIGRGSIVALMLERSECMIISMLAVMKAGAAYLPLNPKDPSDRLKNIMESSHAGLLITHDDLYKASEFYTGKVSIVHTELPRLSPESKLENQAGQEDIAYVIYTSGSTGTPKGVAVRHVGVANMAAYAGRMFELTPADTVLQFASYTFDASVFEIYTTLLSGGTLRLVTEENIRDKQAMEDLLEGGEITVFSTTPSYLNLMNLSKLKNLRVVVTAGEEANPDSVNRLPGGVRYFNGYGPTECSVAISFYEVHENEKPLQKIPVGRPLIGLKAYILDQDGQLAPPGVPGELFVSGTGLAAGYLNDTAQNEKRFVYLHDIAGEERLYRTGDICQWEEQGNLVFTGREDEQFKIRGFRVETGEISQALKLHPSVTDAAIAVWGFDGREYLAAYYVSDEELEEEELSEFMQQKVPEYMVPVSFSSLEKIPLTPSNKLDKRNLPEPRKGYKGAKISPRNETEGKIAEIWQQELGDIIIGVDDNFFQLGGNSLKAISVINNLQEAFTKELSFDHFFDAPTVRSLAAYLDTAESSLSEIQIPKAPPQTYYRLPFQQAGMWVRYEFQEVGRIPFNSSGVNEWPGLDLRLLPKALLQVIDKHEVLRSSFHTVDNVACQKIHPAEEAAPEIEYYDFTESQDEKAAIEKIISEGHQTMMDLETPGLMRVIVIRNREGGYIIQIVIPHFIVDGWSRGIFERDLEAAYTALEAGKNSELEPLRVQSADYAEWYYDLLESDRGAELKKYWDDKLRPVSLFQLKDYYRKDSPPELVYSHREKLEREMSANFYPMDDVDKERAFRHIASAQTYAGAGYAHHIDTELFERIREMAEEHESGVFSILVAGLARCLWLFTREKFITIGSVTALRNHPDLQSLIGSFTNIVLYRLQPEKFESVEEYLESVKNEVRASDAHKLYPFEYMLNDTDYSLDALGELWLNFDTVDHPMADALQSYNREHRSQTYPYFNLNLTFTEYTDGVTMDITYKTAYFEAQFIEQLLDEYISELKKMVLEVNKVLT
ncbi:amino acid adenylation domain-containing protein [Roseivirga sp. BDSF3-8]|uniref:non-ribosomal peptide synthetase n=1 Tax=Roseivirga sp. BDSF3-8 TaxID=3241598 RepID=UPI0035327190